MTDTPRELRRCALLLFPDKSLNAETLDGIVAEGFTDGGVAAIQNREQFPGSGFLMDQGRLLAEMARERALGLIIFTGYMKYQEPLIRREPRRGMISYGAGEKLDSDGLPARWLCPFQLENKADYLDILREIAQWPAVREIHLNDEASLSMGGAIGCYCEYCSAQFESLTGSGPPRTMDPNDPLWWRWTEYRMQSWTAVHAEFRAEIRKLRPEIAVGIQHSPKPAAFVDNPWQSAISLARDARALDVLATDPYPFHHFDLIPYRPHRRILTEVTRSLAGACLDKDVNIYPQAFMPSTKATPMGRQDGLLAGIVPFALGADTITPYAYELMKIIPGFTEGLLDARQLQPELARGRPHAFSTAIRPLQSEVRGRPETNWGRWYLTEFSDVMLRTGLPWAWFWDERLEDASAHLHGPLVLPDAHCLTAEQLAAVQQVARRGEGVLWIGNMPGEPWSGRGPCPLPAEFERGQFELTPEGAHPLLEGVAPPIMLQSRVRWSGPEGTALASMDGAPGLVLMEGDDGRQAWLAGLPIHSFNPKGRHAAVRQRTGGVDLIRNLLRWLSPTRPAVRLEPFPPPNDYGKLRPWDIRDIPTMELLPVVSDDAIFAIVFPYRTIGFETSLVVNLPDGAHLTSIRELWADKDLTASAQHDSQGEIRLPLNVPGSCELLAILVEFERRT